MSEEQSQEIILASFFERVVAFVIDLTFLNLILTALAWILIREDIIMSMKGLKILTYIMYLLFFLYFAVCSTKGKTLGKLLVGLEVVNKEGDKHLTFLQGIFRTFGYVVEILTLFCGTLLAFFNQKRRTLHDILGSSMVISTRKKSPSEEMAFTILGTLIICSFLLSVYYVFFKAPLPFDTKNIDRAKKQLERLAYLEEVHKENFGYYTDDLRRLSLISGDGVQLNRDIQQAFKRRGFKIGLTKDKTSYRIEGYAKDTKESLVFKEKAL